LFPAPIKPPNWINAWFIPSKLLVLGGVLLGTAGLGLIELDLETDDDEGLGGCIVEDVVGLGAT
jgi:hypothetical protein